MPLNKPETDELSGMLTTGCIYDNTMIELAKLEASIKINWHDMPSEARKEAIHSVNMLARKGNENQENNADLRGTMSVIRDKVTRMKAVSDFGVLELMIDAHTLRFKIERSKNDGVDQAVNIVGQRIRKDAFDVFSRWMEDGAEMVTPGWFNTSPITKAEREHRRLMIAISDAGLGCDWRKRAELYNRCNNRRLRNNILHRCVFVDSRPECIRCLE